MGTPPPGTSSSRRWGRGWWGASNSLGEVRSGGAGGVTCETVATGGGGEGGVSVAFHSVSGQTRGERREVTCPRSRGRPPPGAPEATWVLPVLLSVLVAAASAPLPGQTLLFIQLVDVKEDVGTEWEGEVGHVLTSLVWACRGRQLGGGSAGGRGRNRVSHTD